MSKLNLSELNPEQVKAIRDLDSVTEDFCNKLEETLTHLRTHNNSFANVLVSDLTRISDKHSKAIVTATKLLNQK